MRHDVGGSLDIKQPDEELPGFVQLRLVCRTLPAGMKRGEPLYMLHVVLEGTIYFVMALSAAEAVWPWLSGQSSHLDLARAGVSIIAFGTFVLSWKHVKAMNRAAHFAIQQEIEKTKTAAFMCT